MNLAGQIKKWWQIAMSALLCTVVLGSSAITYAATSASPAQNGPKVAITLNGQSEASVDTKTVSGAIYLPIQYIMQMLNHIGLKNTWNGTEGTWFIETPSLVTPLLITQPGGQDIIQLNHKPIDIVKDIVVMDTQTGQREIYMPIQYISKLLSQLQIQHTWNPLTKTLSVKIAIVHSIQTSVTTPLNAGDSSAEQVAVTVLGDKGQPIAQEQVTANSLQPQVASVSQSAMTNANGTAVFYVKAGTKAGTTNLQFVAGTKELKVSWQTLPAAPVGITWQGSTSMPDNPAIQLSVQAVVYDVYGNPVPGVTLNFASGNASIVTITPSSVTNDQGVATATITPSQVIGSTTMVVSGTGMPDLKQTFTTDSATSTTSYLGLLMTNQATNDSAYFLRSSKDFYLMIQTINPNRSGLSNKGSSLLEAKPGQILYVFDEFQKGNTDSHTKWFVNSPYATIMSSPNLWYNANSQIVGGATFVATKPGIYTVQAEDRGKYSVPLVITIGLNQLPHIGYTISGAKSGILPLPPGLPQMSPQTANHITYIPYPSQHGWVPISGSTTLPIQHITVQFGAIGSGGWRYELPVINGQFSALLRDPTQGSQYVILYPHYFLQKTKASDKNINQPTPTSWYSVTINTSSPGPQALALLASAHRDYNMSPKFAKVADILLENSTSIDSAIQAISNYATESIIYNLKEDQFNSNGISPYYIWKDALSAWNSHSGICEDYASLSAALLESVGIPAQTVIGIANSNWTKPHSPLVDNNPKDGHIWVRAWNGQKWVAFDPTWSTYGNLSTISNLDNNFFGGTVAFNETHSAVFGMTGTWE